MKMPGSRRIGVVDGLSKNLYHVDTYMHPSAVHFALIGLIVLLGGCVGKEPPLKIAVSPWPGYEMLFLAQELGYFAEEGVEVSLLRTESPGDSRRFFERSLVDAYGATYYELLLSRTLSNIDARAFYAINVSDGADVIIGGKYVKSVEDLRGKRVGVEQGSMNLLLLHHALKENGILPSEVVIVENNQTDMADALATGSIDAAVTFVPFSTQILKLPDTTQIYDSSMAPGLIVDVFVADRELLQKRREDFTAIARAFSRAVLFLDSNREQALKMLAEGMDLNAEELHETIDGIKILGADSQADFFAKGGWAEQSKTENRQLLIEGGLTPPEWGYRDTIDPVLAENSEAIQ